MATQPSFRPDEASSFFPDGRANRPLVRGTIARGHLRSDTYYFTGRKPGSSTVTNAAMLIGAGANVRVQMTLTYLQSLEYTNAVDTFPFPVTMDVLEHGRDRYMIFCVVCHDSLGTGRGTIVERGYTPPPSYHIERLRRVPVGHIFRVITDGYGSMPQYKNQIPPRDRWAIVAYVRTLQISQHFPMKDLSADMKKEWQESAKATAIGKEQP